ncbi:ribosomal protection-like ABC-F family protein [Planococcus sp. YIM B11945]|uniref:ribosomal protection-like ABC-F family protein n=1 Tax=Planococcus sp. YIM B11945 TaxID=3435410 RepID=UPI003D7EA89E
MAIQGKIKNLNIQYGEYVLLEKAGADIPKGARIGIIGANGSGKTSLLEAIATEAPGVEWSGVLPRVAYMKQEVKSQPIDSSTTESRKFETKWKVPDMRVHLSGGEGMKLRLAQALAEKANVLLLDEPTNHLDAESVELVSGQLADYAGTVLVVSHDRYFLDKIATHIWEIEDRNLVVYKGNYSESRAEKKHRRLTQQRRYDKQQAKIASVEHQIAELKDWSGKAHADSTKKEFPKEYYRSKAKRMDVQVRSKQKRLEAELDKERVEKPKDERDVVFEIAGSAKKGKRIIELKNAGKSFGKRTLFHSASFTIQHGEHIGLVGNNGSGKSTLFGMLRGEEEHSGEVWTTAGAKIGYLSQDVFDLPESKTPAELFAPENFERTGEIRTLMNNLGFDKEHWGRAIHLLSMGERVKLKLMEFMLNECNVLLLDEPTNHLDLPSREQLEKTLETFPGTILIATHDHYFMERFVNKLLIFENGRLIKYDGSYSEWQNKRDRNRADSGEDKLLVLETERQAVLGKLSMLKPGDKEYSELDARFLQLSAEIRSAKN